MPRIGIVVPYAADISPTGYYNRQEVGMARALVELGYEVVIFKACHRRSAAVAGLSLGRGIEEHPLPSFVCGTHGIFRPSLLGRRQVDRFIVMSDVQVMVPTVFRWMRRRGLPAFPYIGTLQSDKGRTEPLYTWLLERNLRTYRRAMCYAKTPEVLGQLRQAGANRAELLPVGLDLTTLGGSNDLGCTEAKRSFGMEPNCRVLAFVGRLSEEKRPLQAAGVFQRLMERDPRWVLLVVGSGALEQELRNALACQISSAQVVHSPNCPSKRWSVPTGPRMC